MIWSGTKELENALVEIGTLSQDPENLNHHPEYSFKVLGSSLKRFGQHKPIVIHGDVVICGNGVFEAAGRIGWTHIAVSTFDGSDREARALAIADNKSPEISYFNEGIVDVVGDLLADFTPEELGGFAALDLSDPFGLNDVEGAGADADDEGPAPQKTIRLTPDQWDVVFRATSHVREGVDGDASEGRCIELICADYLAGVVTE
jgi:hypothetical protein